MAIIKKKKWTQAKAAAHLEIPQPKISLLSRGQFSGFSIGKLINRLDMIKCTRRFSCPSTTFLSSAFLMWIIANHYKST